MTKKQFAGTVRAHEIANNIHPQASKQATDCPADLSSRTELCAPRAPP